ncbi:MAG TPA: MBL fold metallo-hydrolase [Oligoflexia bacterium]|nr:MBL fold metallo-hydrolase [Oligoflexia bacterium]HMP48717.1 MBL fold metallo-hydrolase [Oligoflexia bacterium]
MWVKASGELTDNTIQINTAVSSHILVQGDNVAIFDASLWSVREELWGRIAEEVETIEYILLTHAHFDHVGAVPFLREKASHLKMICGRETANLLSDIEVIQKISAKNKEASHVLGDTCDISLDEWKESLTPDVVFNEGEILKLGDGVEIKLIETPGHSVDSVSYFVKPDLLLVVGDAFGTFAGRELVTPSYNHSYNDFMKSIAKVSALDLQVLSFAHSGSLSGEMVGKFLLDIIREAETSKNNFTERMKTGELIDDIVSSVVMEWASEGRFPDGPFTDALKDSIEGMVRSVAASQTADN